MSKYPGGVPPDPRCPPPAGGSDMFGFTGMAAGLSAGLRPPNINITASELRARQSALGQQARTQIGDALLYGRSIGGIDMRDTLKDLKPKPFKDELQDEIDKWLNDIP